MGYNCLKKAERDDIVQKAAVPVGSGSSGILVIWLVIIALLVLLVYFLRKKVTPVLKSKQQKIKNGEGKKFNSLFYVLCALGFVVDFLIFGFIKGWDFEAGEVFFWLIVFIIPGILTQLLYFLPYIIAHYKLHRQETAIFVLNLFAGWTIVIWIICLVWAFVEGGKEKVIQPAVSSAKELEEYKKLLDNNIITQEEFEQKKKQLLDL